ncbi:hypothetical protein FNF29_03914 [Cafeteria roenbergensis]|uniref:Uncharacterized protein n=1 Tax=Cafeteria roenbergensis TaxID=33653 RepID=A0A5A8CHN5_CAFRO|nr:hypothetical protein FNF29_03914 [Cafeteria roenbergensis]|eukprot:KAA0152348.1 hypothetical protein FNF29_03914 [Cafeteria roenbergensis]
MPVLYCHWRSGGEGVFRRAFRLVVPGTTLSEGSVADLCELVRRSALFERSLRRANADPALRGSSASLSLRWCCDDEPLERAASFSEPLLGCVEAGGDVFLDVRPPPAEAAAAPAKAPTAPAASAGSAAATAQRKDPAESPPAVPAERLEQLLRDADAAFAARKLRRADDAWAAVLEADPANERATIGRARVHLDAGRPRKAARLLDGLVARRAAAKRVVDPAVLQLHGQALRQAGRFDDAVAAFDKAGVALPIVAPTAGAPAAAAGALAGTKGGRPLSRLDCLAAAAAAMLDQGNDVGAVQVLNSVLAHADRHTGVLVQYARVTALKGDTPAAIGTLMRAVVADQTSAEVKEAFAKTVALPGALDALLALVPAKDASAASALGFLAMCARDFGAVGAAARLLVHATDRDPASATYALNLVHCLESLGALQLAFEFGRHFLRRNAAAEARNEAAYYCCVAQCLGTLQRGRDDAAGTAPRPPAAAGAAAATTARPGLGTSLSLRGEASTGPATVVHVLGDSHVMSPSWHRVQLPSSLLPSSSASSSSSSSSSSPGAAASAETAAATANATALLVPALTTGIKAWHLRPASVFYPRVHFEAVAGALPTGSTLLCCIGEIDCREGVLLAVEKRRYKDVESGLRKVATILAARLGRLAAERDLTILIQPAAPVLDPTRPIVVAFNAKLQPAIAAEQERLGSQRAAGRLVWLDYLPRMLDGSVADLRFREPEFGLDGTHLHPRYLSLVEDAAAAAVREG